MDLLTRIGQQAPPYAKVTLLQSLLDQVSAPKPVQGSNGKLLKTSQIQSRAREAIITLIGRQGKAPITKENETETLTVAVMAYSAGVADQSAATRLGVDIARVRERYGVRIGRGMREQGFALEGAEAMRELLSQWPPLGATKAELQEVTGNVPTVARNGTLHIPIPAWQVPYIHL
jgi:hypothetical protein